MNGKTKVKKPTLPKSKIKRCKENESTILGGTFSDLESEVAMKSLKTEKRLA